MGQAARSHLSLMSFDPNPRHGNQYGRNEYRSMPTLDHSPLSESPLVSSSSSSNFDVAVLSDPLDSMPVTKSDAGLYPFSDTAFGTATAECQKPHETHSIYRDAMPGFGYEPAGAYNSTYSTRTEDSVSYNRFDPVQHSLCT